MNAEAVKCETVFLWSDPAPGALGDGVEDRPRVTPYLPAADGRSAAVVICPGGGYTHRAPHEGEPIARWLNTLGVAGFVLDYRVSPYRHPIPLGDAQRAIRLVRSRAGQWGIDPERIGILGFSAGGHCAVSAATIFEDGVPSASDPVNRFSSRPDALIACYPVVTFGEHGHQGSSQSLLADEQGNVDPTLREYMSLENRVTADTPPTFLWHTAADPGVPVENSFLLAQALHRHGVPMALHVFPTGRHGLGLGEEHPTVQQWPAICAGWLREIGFAAPVAPRSPEAL